mmetsp:Transcript_41301/g.88716  ORF Transcript_41301/g.88716 Transcript_41301/m.88716 type:complete len:472 (+) Transcript_41301:122-1537(+)
MVGVGQAPDDLTMRRHFAALERLVEVGLSPEAARVALRHLDSWLVSQEGHEEMAAAEMAARAASEPILHVGDRVRLEGLVKNTNVNGMVGTLLAYSAADLRWKVQLSDGQIFWTRPGLMKPLEDKFMSTETSAEESSLGNQTSAAGATASAPTAGLAGPATAAAAAAAAPSSSPSSSCSTANASAADLVAGFAALEAKQSAWKLEQESRDLLLLEREAALHKLQLDLEEQQRQVGEQRQSLARDRALSMATSAAADTGRRLSEPTEFVMGKVSTKPSGTGEGNVATRKSSMDEPSDDEQSADEDDDDEGEQEADEMWDMDWSKLASESKAGDSATLTVTPPPVLPSALKEKEEESQGSHMPLSSASPTSAGTSESQGAEEDEVSEAPSRSSSRYLGTGRSVNRSPSPQNADVEALQLKLEAKRRLAEEHNGQDLTVDNRAAFDKGRMPGVHPSMAAKLEERRRKIDMEEGS